MRRITFAKPSKSPYDAVKQSVNTHAGNRVHKPRDFQFSAYVPLSPHTPVEQPLNKKVGQQAYTARGLSYLGLSFPNLHTPTPVAQPPNTQLTYQGPYAPNNQVPNIGASNLLRGFADPLQTVSTQNTPHSSIFNSSRSVSRGEKDKSEGNGGDISLLNGCIAKYPDFPRDIVKHSSEMAGKKSGKALLKEEGMSYGDIAHELRS